ncbi:tetratricopeptide repeat protein [Gilvimarinus chinensis]|uniref:tetratricopeptide repeat protein n=1 Tax=Gilvimarinus chinensis TaxID=396005 RepID=UPI0003999D0C|nr:hypothetical protein [Gilvimarinus chinensis]
MLRIFATLRFRAIRVLRKARLNLSNSISFLSLAVAFSAFYLSYNDSIVDKRVEVEQLRYQIFDHIGGGNSLTRFNNCGDKESLEAAIRKISALKAIEGEGYNYHTLLGMYYLCQESPEYYLRAKSHMLTALGMNPDDPVIHSSLSYLYSLLGESEKAIDFAASLFELAPVSDDTYFALSASYMNSQDYSSAIDFSSKGLKEFPFSDKLYLVLSLSQYMLSNIQEASNVLLTAKVFNSLPEGYYCIEAYVHLDSKEFESAKEKIENCESKYFPTFYHELKGDYYYFYPEVESDSLAYEAYSQCAEENPYNLRCQRFRGDILRRLGRYRESNAVYTFVVENTSVIDHKIDANFRMAANLIRLKDYDKLKDVITMLEGFNSQMNYEKKESFLQLKSIVEKL